MPARGGKKEKLSSQTIQEIRELREQGYSLTETSDMLGISRRTVAKYQAKPEGMRQSTHRNPEDRFLFYEADPYWKREGFHSPYLKVWESIPFYPDDLPDLDKDPFGWSHEELQEAVVVARVWRRSQEESVSNANPSTEFGRKEYRCQCHVPERRYHGSWTHDWR